MILIVKL